MSYAVLLRPAAERDLRSLTAPVLRSVDAALLLLAENPRPPGAKRLTGSEGFLRVRVGDYRIVYVVQDRERRVVVARIRHRRDVYRGL